MGHNTHKNSTKGTLTFFLRELESQNIIYAIEQSPRFYDDPSLFFYSAILSPIPEHKLYRKVRSKIIAAGASLFSPYTALLRCMGEAVERFAQFYPTHTSILFSSYEEIKPDALDPTVFDTNTSYQKLKFGWIPGFNLSRNTKCFIPLQLISLNYKWRNGEIILPQPTISTGAAGGFDHESTLLRGIYEVVERDSFMTVYLNKIKPQRVDLAKIKDSTIQQTLANCERYKLELYTFDITTDIGIPSFFTLVIDRTGIGHALSYGSKTNFNVKEAIVGSIEEAFLTRLWLRSQLLKSNIRIMDIKRLSPTSIKSHLTRGMFWAHPKMIAHLEFFLNQPPIQISIPKNEDSASELLKRAIANISKRGFDIFYMDITPQHVRRLPYLVYKVVIPALQPMYMDENQKVVRVERLRQVAAFFGKKDYNVNNLPHPFL